VRAIARKWLREREREEGMWRREKSQTRRKPRRGIRMGISYEAFLPGIFINAPSRLFCFFVLKSDKVRASVMFL
jgi:hypothetical protein